MLRGVIEKPRTGHVCQQRAACSIESLLGPNKDHFPAIVKLCLEKVLWIFLKVIMITKDS